MEQRIAIPVFNNRISPLFDTAGRFEIFDISEQKIKGSHFIDTNNFPGISKIDKLKGDQIKLIICAAISRVFAEYITAISIELIPGVIGDAKEVVGAYLNRDLRSDIYLMPGCKWMNRNRRGQCPCYREIKKQKDRRIKR